MRAAAAAALGVLLLAGGTQALASEGVTELPSLGGAGWASLRFGGIVDEVAFRVSAIGEGPALYQVVVFDEHDDVLAWVQLEQRTLGARADAQVDDVGFRGELAGVPILSSSAAMVGASPCGGIVGHLHGPGGRRGLTFDMPASCGGRIASAAILATSGRDLVETRFGLVSWAAPQVTAQQAGDASWFLDARDLAGTVATASADAVITPLAAGVAHGSFGLDVERGLVARFGAITLIPQAPGLSYRHADESGVCPCSWTGGADSTGAWTLDVQTATTAPILFAGVDAALPPRGDA